MSKKFLTPINVEGTGSFSEGLTAELLDLNEASITAKVNNITTTSPLLVDSFSVANYRSAEYLLQFSQGSLNFGMTRLMLLHNGINEIVTSEYSSIETGTNIPYTFNAYFSLGSIEVTIACSNANSIPVNLKFSRVLFDV